MIPREITLTFRDKPAVSPSPSARSPQASGRLPDFVIIGTQKGGTTALAQYLRAHPQIDMPERKEIDFFIDAAVDPYGLHEPGTWHLGVDWYRRQFPGDKPICGEASPNYTLGPNVARVVPRMATVLPAARLIYLVRNPLERIRSHYRMTIRKPGAVASSFPDFVAHSDTLATSAYGTALRALLRRFPAERILVLESADLDHRRRESLASVFRFLGVDDRFWSAGFDRQVFVGSSRPHVSPRGAKVRDSAAMAMFRRRLSKSAFYHIERLLLGPFLIPDPPLDLPHALATEVVASMMAEMNLLRDLTGLRLPSLEVTMAQATSHVGHRSR